jgi:hypothetical protein
MSGGSSDGARTVLRHTRHMTGHDQRPVSLILRVLPGPAADGELIGQIETVDSGVVAFLRRGDDAVGLLCRAAVSSPEVRRRH